LAHLNGTLIRNSALIQLKASEHATGIASSQKSNAVFAHPQDAPPRRAHRTPKPRASTPEAASFPLYLHRHRGAAVDAERHVVGLGLYDDVERRGWMRPANARHCSKGEPARTKELETIDREEVGGPRAASEELRALDLFCPEAVAAPATAPNCPPRAVDIF
jgi:hypothetical protein